MHTFFINTSDRDFMSDREIMDIEITNRKLIMLNYSLKEWKDTKKGYNACAEKISELIDNHRDINNDFNIVIYVDLTAIELYNSLEPNIDNHLKREACLFTFYSVLKHYISDTLIKRLKDLAREPVETVIIFEENQKPREHLNFDDEKHQKILEEYMAKVIGFPDEETFKTLLPETYPELYKKIADISSLQAENERYEARMNVSIDSETAEKFTEKISGKFNSDYLKIYIKKMLRELTDNHCESEIRSEFLMNIYRSAMDNREISCTSFVTNNRAAVMNMTENLKRKLRIYMYLMEGVRTETFLYDSKAKSVCEPDRETWLNLNEYFVEKKRIYKTAYEKTLNLQESYSEKHLSPKLYAFDNEKFAVSEHGENVEGGISDRRIFSSEQVEEFDYDGSECAEKIRQKPDVKPKEYISTAENIRKYHVDYLNLLQEHIAGVLSNYAHRGDDRKPPVLKKRVVNIDSAVTEQTKTVCNYKKSDELFESRKNVIVEKTAEKSYETVQNKYFEFCAAEEIELTNIDEQYHWLVERIGQIERSLKKMKTVAVVSLVTLIVTYIPYILIQWEAITLNFAAFFTALSSLAMPVVLLGGVFGIVVARQKRKFKEVWNKFWQKNLQALEDNKKAAKHYDRLLTFYIPTLRYTYEYYQDVRFKKECESIAETKIAHHLEMLKKRVEQTEDIIDKLQLGDNAEHYTMPSSEEEIEYNRAYCSGKKNREFYSIIDDGLLKIAKGED